MSGDGVGDRRKCGSGRGLLTTAGIAAAVILLGASRLWLGTPQVAPIGTFDDARAWADCFGRSVAIAASVTVEAIAVEDMRAKDPAPATLGFEATGPVSTSIPDEALKGPPAAGAGVLKAQTVVTLQKSSGSIQFVSNPSRGVLAIRYGVGPSLLDYGPVRFGPSASLPYQVVLDTDVAVQVAGTPGSLTVTLPAGTSGTLPLGTGQTLEPLQPIAIKPWLLGLGPTMQPTEASARKGLNDLAVEARQPGLKFDAQGFSLQACAKANGNGPRRPAWWTWRLTRPDWAQSRSPSRTAWLRRSRSSRAR